jgi:CTP:molybdopterin cytidylyltransferase MocA
MEYYGCLGRMTRRRRTPTWWRGLHGLRTAAVIFEGGEPAQHDLHETLIGLRHAVTLDAIEKYRQAGLDEVVLATNYPQLARAAGRLGARIWDTREARPFHFGRVLREVVEALGVDAVLYTSGAALPLLTDGEIRWILDALRHHGPCVVVNNVQSVDLVAWHPAAYLERIALPDKDNFLGWLLREAGMERILIPSSAGVHFDLDTPTDFLILAVSGQGGPRTRAALRALPWSPERLLQAADILAAELPEVALIGRVGTQVVDHCNKHLRVRLRVFSEERGMKALGREEQGLVVSLMADMIEALGPKRFFERLSAICAAAFIDTRVLFAHRGRRVSEWDRYHSDLGLVDRIRDPWVRAFTEAAWQADIPVVLGGHSVVAGGLWVLLDRAIALRGGPALSQARGFAPA